ncbi:MAG: BFD-like (2Fe-2S) protein [Deltaproteobacteria bacterium]|nr:BFD-like (2Fe-2S) protein [Deltaproteobacteria bacterium]
MNLFNKTADPEDHFKEDDWVCYCFRYTRRDIEQDFMKNGHSTILEKIIKEKSSGRCECGVKSPKGK